MKTVVWLLFVVLSLLWTGLAFIAVQLTDWLATSVGSGQLADVAAAPGQWPVPAALALWLDQALVESLQASWLVGMQWFGQALPWAGGLIGWISPLLWIAWSLGMLLLLVLAIAGHWLAAKKSD